MQSPHAKKNKNVNLLNKILLVSNWVRQDNPQQISQVFDEQAVAQTQTMYKKFKTSMSNDLKDIESIKLSPNLQTVNSQVRSSIKKLKLTKTHMRKSENEAMNNTFLNGSEFSSLVIKVDES